jgi:hypothetical protein
MNGFDGVNDCPVVAVVEVLSDVLKRQLKAFAHESHAKLSGS